MNSTGCLDFRFEIVAFGLKVGGVAVENVHVVGQYVDVLEEVVPHEVVVALGMFALQANVLVHVERFDVLE